MISSFINWIKEQEFYDNTTIILIGDHLTMNDLFYSNQNVDERTIYNAFINSPVLSDNYFNSQQIYLICFLQHL